MEYKIERYQYYKLSDDIMKNFIDPNEYTFYIHVTHKNSFILNLIRNYILVYHPVKCFKIKKETFQNTVTNGKSIFSGYMYFIENLPEMIPINQDTQIDSEYYIDIENKFDKSISVFSKEIKTKNPNINTKMIFNQCIYLGEMQPGEKLYIDLEIKKMEKHQGPNFNNGNIIRKNNTISIPIRCVAENEKNALKYVENEFKTMISSLNKLIDDFNESITESLDSNEISISNEYDFIIPCYRNHIQQMNLKYIINITEVQSTNINNKLIIIHDGNIDFDYLKTELKKNKLNI
jgi:hypothetical protein